MEKNSNAKRLQTLDGIRGIAILLVFFNHVEIPFLAQILPSAFSPVSQVLFSSGVTGVSLLFILSGFLMTYIYPNPTSYRQFLQKRYTRIFPLFITMCTVMIFYHVLPDMAWFSKAILILGLAIFVHVVWVYGIKKIASIALNKTLFVAFAGLQILTALFYIFWIMRQPPIVFNQQLPETIRNGIIWLVNVTLTLPFGTYIPQLDGVYWSLTSEILFYVVYPIVCVPLIGLMMKKKRVIKILVLIALIPFFAGLQILAQRVYGLGILQLQLFYYFICGIVLAHLYRNHLNIFHSLGKIFSKKLQFITVLLFLTAISLKTLLFDPYNKAMDIWIHILWAIPLGLVIAIALSNTTLLSRFLSSRILVFLGTISFSIYLSHIPIGILLKQMYQPTDGITNILSLLLHLGLTILASMVLYYLLERPYFMRRKTADAKLLIKKVQPIFSLNKAYAALIITCLLLLFAIFNSYQSNFNFFSKEYAINTSSITSPASLKESSLVSMKEYPKINIEFTSPENNLQILTLNVHEKIEPLNKNKQQTFIFKIKEAGSKDWYAINNYNLNIPINSDRHPLGFPTINDAKGKNYIVELSITNPASGKYLIVNASPTIMTNVVQVNKKTLLTNPGEFISFTSNKAQNVFQNQEARYVLLLLSPFFLICIYYFATYRMHKRSLAYENNKRRSSS